MPSDDGSASSQIPSRLGKYQLLRKLGQGGMGSVYLARSTTDDLEVALKVLDKENSSNPILVQRFHSEASAAATLDHKNIVRVYDAGEDAGYLYLALEYLPGTDVQRLINRRKKLPIGRSIEIIKQIALALQHAADIGIVHRDIKPSNLLISKDGTVKITDMGLARFIDEEASTDITRAGTTVGTVDYMAPEQAKSSRLADTRSDLYSLGCTWFHMLTGSPPFPEGSMMNKLVAHASSARPDPRKQNPQVPAKVVRIIHKMMARKKTDRFQSPAELVKAIDNLSLERQENSSQEKSSAEETILEMASFDLDSAIEQATRQTGSSKSHKSLPARTSGTVRKRPKNSAPNNLPLWIGGGTALLLLIGLMAWMFSGGKEEDTPGNDTSVTEQTDNPDSVPTDPRPKPPDIGPETPVIKPDEPQTAWIRTNAETQKSLPYGSEDLRKYLPEWINTPDHSSLPVRTVGRNGFGTAGDYASLQQAFDEIPLEGAIIRLQGTGPFLVPEMELMSEGPIEIRGDTDAHPLLLFPPKSEAGRPSHLQITSELLILKDVDIICLNADRDQSRDDVLIQYRGPELRLDSVSVLDEATSSSGMTGIEQVFPAGLSRTLVHQTFFHGENLQPVHVRSSTADIIVHHSVLATGNQPVIAFDVAQAVELDDASSHITVLQSACVSHDSFLQLGSQQTAESTPLMHVLLEQSQISVPSGSTGETPVLLRFTPWPISNSSIPDKIALHCQQNQLPGWLLLMQTDNETVSSVLNFTRMWKTTISRTQFQQNRQWPRQTATLLKDVNPVNYAFAGGPDAEIFDVLSTANLNRCRTVLHRPNPGDSQFENAHGTRRTDITQIEVDPVKQDLGLIVEQQMTNGLTEFIVTGSGPISTSPVLVRNGRVRLTFVQEAGKPKLRVRPKIVDFSRTRGRGEALFMVESGALEIVGLNAELMDSEKNDYPRYFAKVTDGALMIRNCQCTGPNVSLSRYRGMILWEHSLDRALSSGTNHELRIDRSFIRGPGTLIEADLADEKLCITDSILAGDIPIQAKVRGEFDAVLGRVLIEHSTLLATKTLLDVSTEFLDRPDSPLLRIFVEDSILAAPTSADDVTLMTLNRESKPDVHIGWWSDRDIVSSGVELPNSDPITESAWESIWRPGSVKNQIVRSTSSIFFNLPEKLTALTVADCTVQGSVQSTSVTGTRAGADPELIDETDEDATE